MQHEQARAESLEEQWQKLPLSNDFMFCHVLSDLDTCRQFIERLLHIHIDRLEHVQPQKEMRVAADAKGIRFDLYIKGRDAVYDMEMQKSHKPDLLLRARYYQSTIDTDTLKAGDSYRKLTDVYIIFLCMFDPFSHGLPQYTVQRVFKEKPEAQCSNLVHEIYFNCTAYDQVNDTAEQRILKYIASGQAEDEFTGRLDMLVREARRNNLWKKDYMTLEMMKTEEREAGIAIGRDEGFETGMEQAARNLLGIGLPESQIMQVTGLSEERIRQLAQQSEHHL